jgi:hypothetical protein
MTDPYCNFSTDIISFPNLSKWSLSFPIKLKLFPPCHMLYTSLLIQLLPNPQVLITNSVYFWKHTLNNVIHRNLFLFWSLTAINICIAFLISLRKFSIFLSLYCKYIRGRFIFYISYILHNSLNPWWIQSCSLHLKCITYFQELRSQICDDWSHLNKTSGSLAFLEDTWSQYWNTKFYCNGILKN